nr:MAG TPA: hypothetical protein [Caudoviricetes sp.]
MGVLQNGYLQVGFLSGWVGMKLVHPGSAPFSSWFCTVFILVLHRFHPGSAPFSSSRARQTTPGCAILLSAHREENPNELYGHADR